MTDRKHTMEIRVRYAEVDRMGRLHSSRLAVFMEMGRTEMLRRTGMSYREFEAAGVFLVVARLAITFHAPARYDDVVTLETEVARATSARIDHRYRLVRDGALLAEARTTLACVDRGGRVQRMPDRLLAALGIA